MSEVVFTARGQQLVIGESLKNRK